MTLLNSTSYHRTSRAAEAAIASALVIASLFAALLIVELVGRFVPLLGRQNDVARQIYDWDRLIMFLGGRGSIFENHGPIFTYAPHDDIRDVTVFYSDRGFTTEYDYRFRTNNFGLVQDSDIDPARPSLLLLGDSFTEGMGAEPWFRKLVTQNATLPYQLVNGGIRGTGFAQWRLLERYLTRAKLNTRKLIVLFISDDYSRPVANVSQAALRCLAAQVVGGCPEDSTFRLPSADDLPGEVARIRSIRTDGVGVRDRLVKRVGKMLPATRGLYKVFRQILAVKLSPAGYAARRESRAAIAAFVAEHGAANIAFVHLPQKSEIVRSSSETGLPNAFGLQARQDIENAGGKLYDGFKLCGLTPSDYHVHDGHPNERGYDKIARCVGAIVRRMTAADPPSGRQGG